MNITVSDPFNAKADPALATLEFALDPLVAKREFKRRLPVLSGDGRLRLKAIRVVRHKLGRRCVVEYDVEVERPDMPVHEVTILGKVRTRRSGNEGFRQLEIIWNSGFNAQSKDRVSVPEPIGVISRFQMWFQRKVKGETATHLLAGPGGVALARRVAEASHKLHCAGVLLDRSHDMADELRILRECMAKVAVRQPKLAGRTAKVMAACERLGATVPEPKRCGIHRDFYPAQVMVDGSRLWLIDFDLFCLGDPGLDVGNFIGHMTEQSLRERGGAAALADAEQMLEDRFVELSGETTRVAVRAYTTLTLVRHIYLSTQFAERKKFTKAMLELCEARLGLT